MPPAFSSSVRNPTHFYGGLKGLNNSVRSAGPIHPDKPLIRSIISNFTTKWSRFIPIRRGGVLEESWVIIRFLAECGSLDLTDSSFKCMGGSGGSQDSSGEASVLYNLREREQQQGAADATCTGASREP